MDLQPIENIHYEEQKLNTRFYLSQVYQFFLYHLTSTFSLSTSHLFLSEHTWNHHQVQSRPLLESTQEENGFLPKTQSIEKIRDE